MNNEFKIYLLAVIISGLMLFTPINAPQHKDLIISMNRSLGNNLLKSATSSDPTVTLDFETSPPGNDLNNYSNYVIFQPGWYRLNMTGNTTFPAHSGSFVLRNNFGYPESDINFTVPQTNVNFWFIYHDPNTYKIIAFNRTGQQEVVIVNTPDLYQHINFTSSAIISLSVYGNTAGFNLDDFSFQNDTNADYIPNPTFLHPKQNEVMSGYYNISWYPTISSLGYIVRYNITLRSDSSPNNLYTLTGGSSTNWIGINTLLYPDGPYFLDFYSYDNTSGNYLIYPCYINNSLYGPNHTLSTPVFYSPVINNTYAGLLNISWSQAIDSQQHGVSYNLTLIPNQPNIPGLIITSNLASPRWQILNTSIVPNGFYKLILGSSDGYGLSNTIETSFFINNSYSSISYPTNSSQGSNSSVNNSSQGDITAPGFEFTSPLAILSLVGIYFIKKKRKKQLFKTELDKTNFFLLTKNSFYSFYVVRK